MLLSQLPLSRTVSSPHTTASDPLRKSSTRGFGFCWRILHHCATVFLVKSASLRMPGVRTHISQPTIHFNARLRVATSPHHRIDVLPSA